MVSDASVPGWLRAARARWPRPAPEPSLEVEDDWGWPTAGEIRRAAPLDPGHGEARLVVVLHVDRVVGCVRVALLTPETEFATQEDLMILPAETGLSYTLLVECDRIGPVWRVQLGPCLGVIPAGVMAVLGSADQSRAAERRGMPLRDELDVRRRFKQREQAIFQALVAPCDRELSAGVAPVFADPALLQPPSPSATDAAAVRLLDLLQEVDAGETMVPAWLLDLLMTDGSLAAWREHEADALTALGSLYERALGTLDRESPPPGVPEQLPSSWQSRAGVDPVADRALVTLVGWQFAAGRRCIRLSSAARFWRRHGSVQAEAEEGRDRQFLAVHAHWGDRSCQLVPVFSAPT